MMKATHYQSRLLETATKYDIIKQRKESIMFYEEEYYNPYDDLQAPEPPLYENDLNGNGIDDDCEDPYDMDGDGYDDYSEYY